MKTAFHKTATPANASSPRPTSSSTGRDPRRRGRRRGRRGGREQAHAVQLLPSKDDLIAAYLTARFRHLAPSDAPAREQILGNFDRLERMFADGSFRGCPYVNASPSSVIPSTPRRASRGSSRSSAGSGSRASSSA